MTEREKAISYLSEGHALLRAHGLYGAEGSDAHTFAIDRALASLARQKGVATASCGQKGTATASCGQKGAIPVSCKGTPRGRHSSAILEAETAAALQALYEAKRLVTARSSIEGRRIVLGDWFMSLAVGLSLPMRSPALTGLVSEELCRIGSDANRISVRASKKSFCATIDRFAAALYGGEPVFPDPLPGKKSLAEHDMYDAHSMNGMNLANGEKSVYGESSENDGDNIHGINNESNANRSHRVQDMNDVNRAYEAYADNILLSAIGAGYYKAAAAEARSALAAMDAYFTARYASDEASEMDSWIYSAIMSGGKRLRPLLVCLCAGLGPNTAKQHGIAVDGGFFVQTAKKPGKKAKIGKKSPVNRKKVPLVSIMAAIELMHSASLVHDDIVDRSPMRRSRATINAEKGDGYAAMCGFRMIADALSLMTGDVPERIPEIIAAIPMRMCGGELKQFDIENKPELQSEGEYYRRIGCKTAALIEGSCVCGAILGGAGEQEIRAISGYGRALGLLFQLRDDLLDYSVAPARSTQTARSMQTSQPGQTAQSTQTSQSMQPARSTQTARSTQAPQPGQWPKAPGKPVSQDMERGIYTLPLLYARKRLAGTDHKEATRLDAVMRKHIKSASDFEYLNAVAEKAGGLAYAREAIETQAGAALSALALLPRGPYAEALALLVTALAGTQSHTPAEPMQVAK